MTDFITKSVNSRTITAFFDTREAAQNAVDSLLSLGVARHQIQMTEGDSTASTSSTPAPEIGFWESLKSIFLPEEDRHSYAEGLRRGGYLLSVEADPALYDRAMEVLDTDSAVDMDAREAQWRAGGWQGFQADPSMALGAAAGMAGEPLLTTPVPTAETGSWARDTSHDRQRLRSYMMEDEPQGKFARRFSPATDANLIAEHMDVIASDETKIGTVDHLDGDRIKLTKTASPDGQHHFIALTSVDHVDAHVHLNKSASEARASW